MKRIVLPLLFLAMSLPMFAQTTYTQTTRGCGLVSCINAQFSPAATLSYDENLRYYGGSFTGAVIWNGVSYTDFSGSLFWRGYGKHYPYAIWELVGTFDGGLYTVTEDFECFRSCGVRSNISGSVVGP